MDASVERYAEWVLHPPVLGHPTLPRSSYFVGATPRSGSWLLCGLLASTGVAGRPHEWFWRDAERANSHAWEVSSFDDYLARAGQPACCNQKCRPRPTTSDAPGSLLEGA